MKALCKICKVRELQGNTWHCGACWMSGKVETKVTDCGKYVYAIDPDDEPEPANPFTLPEMVDCRHQEDQRGEG